jgi:hypothetical protein
MEIIIGMALIGIIAITATILILKHTTKKSRNKLKNY